LLELAYTQKHTNEKIIIYPYCARHNEL